VEAVAQEEPAKPELLERLLPPQVALGELAAPAVPAEVSHCMQCPARFPHLLKLPRMVAWAVPADQVDWAGRTFPHQPEAEATVVKVESEDMQGTSRSRPR